MGKRNEKYLLYIGVVAALLPLIILRDFTPANELRYLSIADEALRDHTLFTFHNHGVPYTDKPPLYLWIVMLCRWITGAHHMWLLSLFSLIPALATVGIMDNWTRYEMDRESRALARMMLITSGLFLGAAIILRMDMLMTMFIVLALRAFWKMHESGTSTQRHTQWLFPLYIFLAIFTKGPLGLLIPLCCTTAYLALSGELKQFLRYWGIRTWSVLIACCAIWFAAVYMEGGGSYLHDMLFHQTLDRAVNSFHHKAPFYYYAVAIWYCIAPWALLVIGITIASLRPKFVRSSLQRFFLTAAVTTFALLSCVSAKLEIYFLPAIPFFIYTAAMFMSRFEGNRWPRIAVAVPAVVFAIALPVLALMTSYMPFLNEGMLYTTATVLTLTGMHSLYILYKSPKDLIKIMSDIGKGMLIAVFTFSWTLPILNAYIGYGSLSDKALEMSQQYGINDIRAWKLSRVENMDVYLGDRLVVISGEDVPLPSKEKPYLLLTQKENIQSLHGSNIETVGEYAVIVMSKKYR